MNTAKLSILALLSLVSLGACSTRPQTAGDAANAESVAAPSAHLTTVAPALGQASACRVRLSQPTAGKQRPTEKDLPFTEKNADGRVVRTALLPLSPAVSVRCEGVAKLSCVFVDAKRPSYIKASASSDGETLSLSLLDGGQLYEAECLPAVR